MVITLFPIPLSCIQNGQNSIFDFVFQNEPAEPQKVRRTGSNMAKLTIPGLYKLFHPAIHDGRTWNKCGEHGEHGKDGKHQPGDLKHSTYDSKHSCCDSKRFICQPSSQM